MKIDPVARRLRIQKLVLTKCRKPAQVVSWLGAVQAQDYAGAKWALGLRSTGLDDRSIDRAFNEGSILRTHMMRLTWHFVAPEDIRWIQRLTGPRVNALNGLYYRKGGLDTQTMRRGVSRGPCGPGTIGLSCGLPPHSIVRCVSGRNQKTSF